MSDNYRKVFLSYAREDKEQAQKIMRLLSDYNFQVWFDENGIDGGDKWVREVKQ